jgi:hypothetical protein
MQTSTTIQAVNDAIVAWLDRHRRALLLLLLAGIAILLVVRARAKFLWHDEVYTILGSRLSLLTLWRASLDGFDLSPPLNTAVTHFVHAVTGEGPIATRLPPMAGLLTAVTVLFVVVRRKANIIVAVTAALLLCATPAWHYAIEARGYGLALGLFALAIYGWSEAAGGRRVTPHLAVMSASLAAGVWTHYYGVLAFLPIAAAEATRQLTARRFQHAPWAALLAAAAAVLPLVTLARTAGSHRTTFWTRGDAPGVLDIYSFLLEDLAPYRLAIAALGLLAVVEIVRRSRTRHWPRRLAVHDLVLCATCLAVPAAAILLGSFTNVLTERYVLFSSVGLALALPLLVWSVLPPEGVGDWLAAGVVTVLFAGLAGRAIADRRPTPNPLSDRPVLVAALNDSTPLAMTGGVAYLELWYYATPETQARAVYLADPRGQRRETGSDTADLGYLALARWSPVPVVPISAFVKTHKRFWLYSFDSRWAERTLRRSGATMTERARETSTEGMLLDVQMAAR